jgi:hypothetical protein
MLQCGWMCPGPTDTTHPIVREPLQKRLAHRDEQGITLARRLRGELSLVDGPIDRAAEICIAELAVVSGAGCICEHSSDRRRAGSAQLSSQTQAWTLIGSEDRLPIEIETIATVVVNQSQRLLDEGGAHYVGRSSTKACVSTGTTDT